MVPGGSGLRADAAVVQCTAAISKSSASGHDFGRLPKPVNHVVLTEQFSYYTTVSTIIIDEVMS